MFAFTRPRYWALFFTEFRCHSCGSSEGYVSRPRNFVEAYVLDLFSLRPARCGDCYRRSWRPAKVRLMRRMGTEQFAAKVTVASARPAEGKGTQKETQAPPEKNQHIA
jgi:uncharacterized protein with PIN domain